MYSVDSTENYMSKASKLEAIHWQTYLTVFVDQANINLFHAFRNIFSLSKAFSYINKSKHLLIIFLLILSISKRTPKNPESTIF